MTGLKQFASSSERDVWENAWAPYDAQTYADALAALDANDIVLDIGAGDLRFAKRAAQSVKQVIAIEQRAELLPNALPENVRVVCGDARQIEFPQNVTAAILLMRHCRHFKFYREKLERVGCQKLITNARWGMNVEVIDLTTPRIAYSDFIGGWYACECGAVGCKETQENFTDAINEVMDCPKCVTI